MKPIAAVVLSALLGISQGALAISESEPNTLASPQSLGTYVPGASFSLTGTRATSDVDFYTFGLSAAAWVSLNVVTTSGYTVSDPILGLWGNGGATPVTVQDGGGAEHDNGDDPVVNSTFLAAGTYLIGVTHFNQDAINSGTVGDFHSSDASAWNYTLNVQTTPAVPEPETYAMLLAGLGVLGWVGKRRKGA